MRVTSTADARRLVRERGGALYVTLGPRVSTVPPDEVVDTDGFDGGGYLLVLDRRLEQPPELRVEVVDGEPSVAPVPAPR